MSNYLSNMRNAESWDDGEKGGRIVTLTEYAEKLRSRSDIFIMGV